MAFIIQGSDGTQKKIAGLGAPGKSAYQYAVDGGYEGTEEEFASLLSNVQAKISGTTGQLVGFDENGDAEAQSSPVLVVHGTISEGSDTGTADASISEIKEAVQNGIFVILVINNGEDVAYYLKTAQTPSSSGQEEKSLFSVLDTAPGTYVDGVQYSIDSSGVLLKATQKLMVEPSGDDGDYLILGLAGVTTQPPPVRSFGPQTVETSAWESDDTYGTEGYAYRAAIVLSGATSDYAPEVNFSLADSISGNFAPVAETYDGGVYIYAKEIPQAAMNVPSIILMKG